MVALPGCSQEAEPAADATAPEQAETIRLDQYVVRGQVVRLPSIADPTAEFVVRHEAIPHYRASGAKLGMNTMAMPFPVATDLSLAGINVGDKIELTFEVQFDTENDRPVSYQATAITPLPASTELDFTPLPKSDSSKTPDAPAPAQP